MHVSDATLPTATNGENKARCSTMLMHDDLFKKDLGCPIALSMSLTSAYQQRYQRHTDMSQRLYRNDRKVAAGLLAGVLGISRNGYC